MSTVQDFHDYITNTMYEHDQTSKKMSIKQTFEDKFLDMDVVIHPSRKSVKTTYHNKNADILNLGYQKVSRFHDAAAPSPLNGKLSTISNILVKMHDSTTLSEDTIMPCLQLLHEALFLGFTVNEFLSAINKAYRSRCQPYWIHLHNLVQFAYSNL